MDQMRQKTLIFIIQSRKAFKCLTLFWNDCIHTFKDMVTALKKDYFFQMAYSYCTKIFCNSLYFVSRLRVSVMTGEEMETEIKE